MGRARQHERASRGGALFRCGPRRAAALSLAAALALAALAAGAAPCAPDRIDEYAKVARVQDGDTVWLDDGRKVRVIGINTPELGREDAPPEPYAEEAREALHALLEDRPLVGLRFDRERHDRYRRLLAHLYLGDERSIEEWLLERGFAAAVAVPPNLWNHECYLQAERRARERQLGLWSEQVHQPVPATDLPPATRGFRIVEGRIMRVAETEKSIWLTLEGGLGMRIAREDLHYFAGLDPEAWVGRTVLVRGWLHPYRGRPVLRLRHPAALEVSDGR